jgi:hypothetical protein
VIRVDCGHCANSVRIDPVHAKTQLKWKRVYGFGDHVTDPKAFVMRWLTACHGWIYSGGRIGKTVLTMTCPKCRATKLPELPVDPDDQAK